MIFNKVNIPSLLVQDQSKLRPIDRDLFRMLDSVMTNLFTLFARGITIEDNMAWDVLDITTHATPNTEIAVTHTLDKIPTGYFVAGMDQAAIVYNGTTAWTKTTIYVRCTVSSVNVKLIVF